ncbi:MULTISPECIES: N-acetyltransferase [unclassified Chelatococcus]|jgi:ribosomal protein S18 acetylase RimI-like enzyme|uniref:GNAT family N-acetyltransferase n=1 Tax=unclassified Chelatococcus TaxID=2638111 RepID=UPI001BCB3DEB|nr:MULTISPECIES: N-acetyltransferase [unclassified Chelatococcus]MBS7740759.1 GNAT family N-acetyltransferase [Chelatococcus sp. HY11]MBX3546007.1 GNAT family N-acetyltransferase [Chelatococcus sp.]CAH1658071.1 Acetyltransferase (GNAT) family protein [Hyphomicrobiales bacterium]CAH1684248.1 Acetyltransferase (GNAT) family protein [Hyphomicrobiales bacterium]
MTVDGRPSPVGAAASAATPGLVLRELDPADATGLLPLIAAYGEALSHGEDNGDKPDLAYVERLLAESGVIIRGAFAGDDMNGKLVGFALFYDLPEAISRRRAGQIDDLYVLPEARGQGVAGALIADIVAEGRKRGWIQLRWMVPHDNLGAQRLYDRIAEAAPWKNYVIWLEPGVSW